MECHNFSLPLVPLILTSHSTTLYHCILLCPRCCLQPGQHDKLADIIKDEIWLNPMKVRDFQGLEQV